MGENISRYNETKISNESSYKNNDTPKTDDTSSVKEEESITDDTSNVNFEEESITDDTSNVNFEEESITDDKSNVNSNDEHSETKPVGVSEKPDGNILSEQHSDTNETSGSSPDNESQSNVRDIKDDESSIQGNLASNTDSKNSESTQDIPAEEAESQIEEENLENPIADAAPTETNADNQEAIADNQEAIVEVQAENGTPERQEYPFDEIIDMAGYGRFQRLLTFLAGLGWMADAFEIRVLSMLGDFIACDWTLYRWQTALLSSVVFIGMLFGAPCFGIIADNFGRRKSLAISLFFLFLFGASSALSADIYVLLAVRFVTGFVFGGATQGFILCAEYYPAKKRGIAGFYLRYYWAFGTLLLILMTWIIMEHVGNWRWLVVAAATPSLLVFFSMNWFPESARWYLVSGKYDKAVAQLSQLLVMNDCTEVEATQLRRIPEEEREKQGSLLDLLRSPYTKTTLLLWYISFAAAFHYYGVTLISPYIINRGQLMVPEHEKDMAPLQNATNPKSYFLTEVPCRQPTSENYHDLLWNSCSEFPGLIVFTILVRYLDRRTLLSVSCLTSAFTVLILLAEAQNPIPTKVILFIARANCCGILQLVMIITMEIWKKNNKIPGVLSLSADGT